ncbi:MAG: glycosyl transferase, family 39 [Bryobacterales bacterium]|nr:glycosyl transferase, family 39 [Bryobacterales bacterium]
MAKARKKRTPAVEVAIETREPRLQRVERFLDRRAAVVALILILAGSIRIVTTYTVFSQTSDEPAHLASGMQWLNQGIYRYETQHPPLTRIMTALGPYLDGARSTGQSEMFTEGNAILYGGNDYDKRLALSRAGNLPFFWLACWMVFLWGRRMMNSTGAILAVLIFTMTPTVLAHAGLSTTDMGLTACFAAAAYALVRLVEEPGLRTACWFGLASGLMVLSKFSALVFYPAAASLALALWLFRARPPVRQLAHWLRRLLPFAALAALVAFLVIWAGYRFTFGKDVWLPFPTPFPELYSGIRQVIDHNEKGHLSYFMGEVGTSGWWTYFPTLIAVKLPIPVLIFLVLGLWRRPERQARAWPFGILAAIPIAILAVALPARINIGIRHILPAFPFLALIAGSGALWLIRLGRNASWASWTAAAFTLWLSVSSLGAHPDYLGYFNAFAGAEPERIVVDSDLDWGQDIKRLGKRLQELNAQSVAFSPTIMIDPPRFGLPPWRWSAIDAPFPGWNAVQLTEWKLNRMGLRMQEPGTRVWPDFMKPTERVGTSILLYYVPPQSQNAR